MSLSQLLVVNKSLKHKPAGPNPFALTKDRLVPEFPVRRGMTVTLSTAAQPEPDQTERHPEGRPLPVAGKAGMTAERVLPSRWSALAENKNRRRSATRPIALPDNVRVQRNDLSETDFEVLPVKTPPVVARPQSAPGRGAAGIWNRFTARLMSLGLGWFKT
jgi:hypothetical protein